MQNLTRHQPYSSFKIGYHFGKKKDYLENTLQKCSFNHMVSAVFPDPFNIPNSITDLFAYDSDYYRIEGITVNEFLDYNFIEAFVKNGSFVALSDGTYIDVDDCVCLSPFGQLHLSLCKDTYQNLGIEGKPSQFHKVVNKFVITLDLKNNFKPGKKNYERTVKQISHYLQKFDIIFAWEPKEESICPSSAAAYFKSKGYHVSVCHIQHRVHYAYKTQLPEISIKDIDDKYAIGEFFQWLGAVLTESNLKEYSNSDLFSEKKKVCNIATYEWKGLFTSSKIIRLVNHLRKYLEERQTVPWVCLHVAQMSDSLVDQNIHEHTFNKSGDCHYTIMLKPDDYYYFYSFTSPSKKLRNK